jgi:hypothetical protein
MPQVIPLIIFAAGEAGWISATVAAVLTVASSVVVFAYEVQP